jgi:cysteinyl-tRNA synthetase
LPLRISNTLSGRKETFEPLNDPVRIYVCGMTPKNHPHVGHARLFVAADAIRRILEYRGYRVMHVQNFTDIDDKIIDRANREGISAFEAAKKYTDSYYESMARLNVMPAHVYPKVTASMGRIIEYVKDLIGGGFAYELDGDVYFEVERFPEYGKLSGRTEEGQLEGVRKELEPGKRNPRDFALWKRAKPGEPSWPSPWGEGRPGWHIECSTMVRETLGDQIDIHAGGADLLFPHHENEIAQSEAFTGCAPFSKYWAHIGLVLTGSEKMAHSLENFTTIRDVLDKFDPAAVRLYLLRTHYRSPMTFSAEGLEDAARSVRTLRGAYGDIAEDVGDDTTGAEALLERFDEFVDDDFNTAGAIGVLFDTAREVNRAGATAEGRSARAAFRKMARVLGLPFDEAPPSQEANLAVAPFIDLLVQVRTELRTAKQWALSDRIRDGLAELGVRVEDSPSGTTWSTD